MPSDDVATDTITLEAFEACSIPYAAWNHRAHVTVAYLMLRAYPLDEASRRMCAGIRRYNQSKGIEQTPTGGYHETLTIAWTRLVHASMLVHGDAGSAERFLAEHPHFLSKALLRLYYSRERIGSPEARYGWVEPDLAPLPAAVP